MTNQNCISRTLRTPGGAERLGQILEAGGFETRTELGRLVCSEFGFADPLGRLQEASCAVALRELAAESRIRIPEPTRRGGGGGPAGLDIEVPPPEEVPACAGLVSGLRLVPAGDLESRRILAAMLEREHPEGAVRHVGRQLRYLIGSDHGWLGGFVFASSALSLAARDRWIGWDAPTREARLHLVVGLSRFLIRPAVACRNLASRVLGLCRRQLPADYEQIYGVAPALAETFVSPGLFGTSLRAANWTYVGETAGRGRRSAAGASVPVKSIYMMPLAPGWRELLGGREPDGALPIPPGAALGPADGLDGGGWAEQEFGEAPLGDRRLTRRLVRCVEMQAKAPGKTFFSAAAGDWAAVTGYYRLIEQPDESKVSPEAILATHRARTEQRMRKQETVLCIQDGTDLNFATHPLCEGLDRIGKNKNSKGTLGLHLHSTLAVAGDGIPLGVPRIEFSSPDDEGPKSGRWLRGWRDAGELKAGRARVVSVMDREGDIFELFAARRDEGGPDLLVRAQYDRSLGPCGSKLFEKLRGSPERARMDIPLERLSARNAARGQAASPGRAARVASAALRWMEVDLAVPEKRRGEFGTRPCRMRAVHAFEDRPPDGAEPLEWMLLTTLPAGTEAEARDILRMYRLRWRIEDWHRILKSGCGAEEVAFRTAERIKRAAAINAVIAWRLSALTHLGRQVPDLDAGLMYSESELAVLGDFARTRKAGPPETLSDAMTLVAMLGGYLNRKNDGPPGHQIQWDGQIRLAQRAQMVEESKALAGESSVWKLLGPGAI